MSQDIVRDKALGRPGQPDNVRGDDAGLVGRPGSCIPTEAADADRISELQDELNCTRDELDDARAERKFYEDRYRAVERVLDQALGVGIADGTGEGVAADVALLAQQRDDARQLLETLRAENKRLSDTVAEDELS